MKEKTRNRKEFEAYFLEENPLFNCNLVNEDGDFRKKFYDAAESFIRKALEQLVKRLPSLKSLPMSRDCILLRTHKDLHNLKRFAIHFKNLFDPIEQQDLEGEISVAKNDLSLVDNLRAASSGEILVHWKSVEQKYKLLYRLIQAIQLVPCSNANVEREFSQLNLIRTTQRNRLISSSIEACLLIKQETKSNIASL